MAIYEDHTGKTYDVEPEKIGWRIGAYAFIQNDKGEVLTVTPHWNDLYELPGGGIEVDESITDGLVREVKEESGYDVIVDTQPIYVGESNFYYVSRDEYLHGIQLVYRAQVTNYTQDKDAIFTHEIKHVRWIPLNQFHENNTHKNIYPAIQIMQKNKKL